MRLWSVLLVEQLQVHPQHLPFDRCNPETGTYILGCLVAEECSCRRNLRWKFSFVRCIWPRRGVGSGDENTRLRKKKFQDGGCFSFAVEDFEVVLR